LYVQGCQEALATKLSNIFEALRAELQRGLAVDAYAEQHGSFAEFVRKHYEQDDGAI
jgi:hypothetical protein